MSNNKLKKLFPIILFLLLITIIIGVTYAMYNIILQSGENSVTTGLVSMSYTESTNVIDIKNALPISDNEGKISNDYFDFSITSNLTLNENDPNTNANYSITLEPLNTNTLSDNNIKLYLEDITNNKVLIDSKLISDLSNYELYNTSHTHKYNVNTITTKYRLRAWIDYNTDVSNWDSSNSYEYKFRVNINSSTDEVGSDSIYEIIASKVKESNISYKYINNANVIENNITYNSDDNGVFLYNGTDDNGGDLPIYYYRGNVTDNNVVFGNFCFKIVRTTSTGGTKLIYNGVPSDGTCNNTGTSSRLPSTTAFNSNYDSPTDAGYMRGTRYAVTSIDMSNIVEVVKYGNDVSYSNGTYTLTGKTFDSINWDLDKTTLADGYHYTCLNSTGICDKVYYITYFNDDSFMYYLTFTGGETLDSAKTKMFSNITDSTIKTNIDNWYAVNLKNYTDMLENTIFCNDRSFASGTLGGALSSKDSNSIDYSYSAGYERTFATYSPSLQCFNINDRFSLKAEYGGNKGYGNNMLKYPVGLLTLDEVELSGGGYASNNNYYLYTGDKFWILSLGAWDRSGARVGGIAIDGSLSFLRVNDGLGVRPVISLKLGTTFDGGTGLSSDPYIVTQNS